MSLLNTEESKQQIKEGTFASLNDITNEFKVILKEMIQTASQEELTFHLDYDKYKTSDSPNFRNEYNDKPINRYLMLFRKRIE